MCDSMKSHYDSSPMHLYFPPSPQSVSSSPPIYYRQAARDPSEHSNAEFYTPPPIESSPELRGESPEKRYVTIIGGKSFLEGFAPLLFSIHIYGVTFLVLQATEPQQKLFARLQT
jgi:hypothetical protein